MIIPKSTKAIKRLIAKRQAEFAQSGKTAETFNDTIRYGNNKVGKSVYSYRKI